MSLTLGNLSTIFSRMLVYTNDRLKAGNWQKLAPAMPPHERPQLSILLLQWYGCQKKKQPGS